ncbi:hypothetical protein ACIB24_13920 [Spongisporangium articulatum]|uniref:Uncharacterized protein n=1 Tax=Spongisporangium articulatum TaxID=3362603 RepID=A0ABW8AP64_9ACTN
MTRRGSALLVGVLLTVALLGNRQAMSDTWQEWYGPKVQAAMSAQDFPDGPLARRRDASGVWTGYAANHGHAYTVKITG